MAVLLLASAIVIGCLLMRLANPAGDLRPRWAAFLLESALGAGFGIALVSILFFVLLLLHVASSAIMLSVQAVLLVTSAGFLSVRRKPKTAEGPELRPRYFWWYGMLGGALLLGVLFAAAAMADSAQTIRFGTWDAWNIWNLRAKYLAGPGDTWTRAFSPLPTACQHPDYPLLLSGFIAEAWKFSGGNTTTLVPVLTAAVFAACVLALLVSALVLVRGIGSALLAGLVLVATSSFWGQTMSQYADVPLSFYYLATLLFFVLSADPVSPYRASRAVLAGAFASFAAWTKNEGIVFLALSLASYMFVSLRWLGAVRSRWRHPLFGAIPGILVVVYFKIVLAPRNDLLEQSVGQVLHKIVEFSRYWEIAKALLARALDLGDWWAHPLLLVAILAVTLGFRMDQRQKQGLAVAWLSLLSLFLAYCGVYLITPLDLRFHLSTSLERLYAQMWPSFLLLMFLLLEKPEALLQPRSDESRPSSFYSSKNALSRPLESNKTN
jgi:hypothetical protein